MTTFTFTDNTGLRKITMALSARDLAQHLAKDRQFVFYWRRGWDGRQAAIRSLYAYPPSEKAHVAPEITVEAWALIESELKLLY